MKNPLHYIFLVIIIIAFVSQLSISVEDYWHFFDENLATMPLEIIDEPLRFNYFVFMLVALLGAGAVYYVRKAEKISFLVGHERLIIGGIVCLCVGIGISFFFLSSARSTADSVMAKQAAGYYSYCLFMVTENIGLRAKSTPSYYVYSRVPSACDALLKAEPVKGFKNYRELSAAVSAVNANFK